MAILTTQYFALSLLNNNLNCYNRALVTLCGSKLNICVTNNFDNNLSVRINSLAYFLKITTRSDDYWRKMSSHKNPPFQKNINWQALKRKPDVTIFCLFLKSVKCACPGSTEDIDDLSLPNIFTKGCSHCIEHLALKRKPNVTIFCFFLKCAFP